MYENFNNRSIKYSVLEDKDKGIFVFLVFFFFILNVQRTVVRFSTTKPRYLMYARRTMRVRFQLRDRVHVVYSLYTCDTVPREPTWFRLSCYFFYQLITRQNHWIRASERF